MYDINFTMNSNLICDEIKFNRSFLILPNLHTIKIKKFILQCIYIKNDYKIEITETSNAFV
jgi:hypothetical protein